MTDNTDQQVLGYGIHGRSGFVVLLPLAELEDLSDFFTRMSAATTVGDYLQLEGHRSGAFRWWDPVDYSPEEMAGHDNSPEASFDFTMVPGFGDGYFPPDPLTWMCDAFDWEDLGLPDGAVEYRDYMASLPQVVINPDRIEEILDVLRNDGFEVVERQDLVDPIL